ncbi:MAG: PH domain-containing protein [Chloroflexaceae bacterium]|nr:PH domain-containing protein [Chloroflexaceae bacterium]
MITAGWMSYRAFSQNTEKLLGLVTASELIFLCGGLISLILLGSIFSDYLRWRSEQSILTDRRMIQIVGVFNKTVQESPLDGIKEITHTQGWVGRLLGYGSIHLKIASEEGAMNIEHVRHSRKFQQVILEAKHHADRGYGYLDAQALFHLSTALPEHPVVNGQSEIRRTLEELASLRDRGILSMDEFETKKREILSRI